MNKNKNNEMNNKFIVVTNLLLNSNKEFLNMKIV